VYSIHCLKNVQHSFSLGTVNVKQHSLLLRSLHCTESFSTINSTPCTVFRQRHRQDIFLCSGITMMREQLSLPGLVYFSVINYLDGCLNKTFLNSRKSTLCTAFLCTSNSTQQYIILFATRNSKPCTAVLLTISLRLEHSPLYPWSMPCAVILFFFFFSFFSLTF